MATIRKRGHKQWEARVRRKGVPVQCRTFDTKETAERWARQVEGEIDKGSFVDRSEGEDTTFAEALDRWEKEYLHKLAESSHQTETSRIKALKRRPLATTALAKVRGRDIVEFIYDLEEEEYSSDSIRLYLATISRVFNAARMAWGMEYLVNPVPLAKHARPKGSTGRERRLEGDEEARVLAYAGPNFRPVFSWALATAMRRSEIVRLEWRDVNLERRTALVRRTKNGEVRTVPLSSAAVGILFKLGARTGAVFGMTEGAITQAMIDACDRAKVDDLRFHDLRHEATSRMFEETDLDAVEIATVTGHKSMQMLKRYTHLRAHKLARRLG
ncbi:tyrosine-type recombinase/integrase [Lichenifustis flavocetrariae]|uniref:Site-specific integrase n=1 Tax=Lichenifustis flavocetrariae TaxID=2949735 RepID=A0AA41YZC7_9HYPH|nr:site-specific integrase [Lichenifustis flavocetrariae]MCW6510065.1 site-specific integrase [Lichenifustis flavocetrariae]